VAKNFFLQEQLSTIVLALSFMVNMNVYSKVFEAQLTVFILM
jgi:hypothetical protein